MATNSEKNISQQASILQSGLEFFYKNGVREIDETELFSSLGITPNAFFATYRNKDEFLLEAIRHDRAQQEVMHRKFHETSANAVQEIMSVLKFGADTIRRIQTVFITDVMNYYPQLMKEGDEYSQNYTAKLYSSIIKRGIREGLFLEEINLEIVSRVILANAYVWLNYKTFPPHIYPPGEVLRNIYLFYFRGLCTEEGMRTMDNYFSSNSF
jgi:AcrR family transcriptional regulator